MTILYHKAYLVKVTTKGEGGSKIPKILTTWFMDDPLEILQWNLKAYIYHKRPFFVIDSKNILDCFLSFIVLMFRFS